MVEDAFFCIGAVWVESTRDASGYLFRRKVGIYTHTHTEIESVSMLVMGRRELLELENVILDPVLFFREPRKQARNLVSSRRQTGL